MTKDEALLIIEAHEIDSILSDEEEAQFLKENNDDLYEAYKSLLKFAGLLSE